MTDLLQRCAELVAIPSVSRDEKAIADFVETRLRAVPWLQVTRWQDNVIADVQGRGDDRVVLAGHLDTVPPAPGLELEIGASKVRGVGSADMKAGLAVMLELAESLRSPASSMRYVFYACEEVDRRENGLYRMFGAVPELVTGDAAIVLEPTDAKVELGCQGTVRLSVVLGGIRAHSARPWMGSNAIHRLGPVLQRVEEFDRSPVTLDGCEFRPTLEAVRVGGGVAGNVVPDIASLELHHRFAPGPALDDAIAKVTARFDDVLEDGDVVSVVDSSPAAAPARKNPLVSRLVDAAGGSFSGKLGWTDVATFAENGVPAVNFGPGNPSLAHGPDEEVSGDQMQTVHTTLNRLLA